jgi:hypothetical protein
MATREVHCDEHGDSPACFVCRHLSESLQSGIGSLGFVVPEALDPGDSPQAWCFECDNFMEDRGGEWDTIGEQFAGITLACSGCFEQLRELNSIARPSS